MKVLHVINYLSDGGGAEKLMEDLLPSLKRLGVDVSIAVFEDRDTENARHLAEAGINIIKIGKGKTLYSVLKTFKLLSVMRNYDIVHAHLTAPFLACAVNSLFYRGKLVTTIHNTDSKFRHFHILRNIEKWALSKYDSIICCSNEAEIYLGAFLGEVSLPVKTITNGINVTKFIRAVPIKSMQTKGRRNITMVAVFRPQKDHTTLIKAMALLPPKFHLYLVGYGLLKSNMEQAAIDYHVASRVHFMGKRTDVPSILKSSDYIVLSSHYEGLSLSSIEGMSVGVPFIASNVPGLKDLVENYGILFNEGDYEQLANIILELENDINYYSITAEKCLGRARMFDISMTAKKYKDEYGHLVSVL